MSAPCVIKAHQSKENLLHDVYYWYGASDQWIRIYNIYKDVIAMIKMSSYGDEDFGSQFCLNLHVFQVNVISKSAKIIDLVLIWNQDEPLRVLAYIFNKLWIVFTTSILIMRFWEWILENISQIVEPRIPYCDIDNYLDIRWQNHQILCKKNWKDVGERIPNKKRYWFTNNWNFKGNLGLLFFAIRPCILKPI